MHPLVTFFVFSIKRLSEECPSLSVIRMIPQWARLLPEFCGEAAEERSIVAMLAAQRITGRLPRKRQKPSSSMTGEAVHLKGKVMCVPLTIYN